MVGFQHLRAPRRWAPLRSSRARSTPTVAMASEKRAHAGSFERLRQKAHHLRVGLRAGHADALDADLRCSRAVACISVSASRNTRWV